MAEVVVVMVMAASAVLVVLAVQALQEIVHAWENDEFPEPMEDEG